MDPGAKNRMDPTEPDPDSDPDLQHCFNYGF
jgi:hypothetical protein